MALVFAALWAWTWRTWPDLLVDFGRELYVPWQLSEGAVLYRDVAYFNGPLSPSVNALLFRAFGVSLTTLVAANTVLLALLTGLLYAWIARAADRLTATLGCLTLLCVFAMAHLVTVGNYNYVCPYSHELTHGVTLSVLMLVLLGGRFGWTRLSVAGVCWGLVFLTKAEIFLAASGGAFVAIALGHWARRASCGRWLMSAVTFLIAGAVPVVLFWNGLAAQMPAAEAMLGVAGSWRWIVASDVTGLHFYRAISGWNEPAANLLGMGKALAAVALAVGAFAFYDRSQMDRPRRVRWILAATVCVAGAVLLRERKFPYLLDGRALLLAGLLMVAGYMTAAIRLRASRHALFAGWAVFGVLLLGKMLLLPRVHHYGFVLAMPVAILAVVSLIGFLPRLVCRSWGGGATFRKVAVAVLAMDLLGYVLMSSSNVQRKSYLVGSGGDAIVTYDASESPVGPAVAQLLQEINATMPSDATFVALPEGVMLNYLTRRRNPTGYVNLMPPELEMYGEDRVIRALEEHAADYIVLVHKDTSEYGVGPFGSPGYGQRIMRWIDEHYRPLRTIGAEPLEGKDFGIKILGRSAAR